jgi:spartin
MVVGKAPGGGDLVVGGGDGGAVPVEILQDPKAGVANQGVAGMGEPPAGQVGFGNAAPPPYASGLGEPIGGQSAFGPSGQDPYGKN